MAHWNFYYWAIALEDPKSNIANDAIEYQNGKLECSFMYKANAQIHVPPPQSNDAFFNLNEELFHLLLAKGPLNEEKKIAYHEVRELSPEPINLAEIKTISQRTQGAQKDSKFNCYCFTKQMVFSKM